VLGIFIMFTITLTGDSSELLCDIFPPLEVSKTSQVCLLSLYTNNSIPNIEPGCNTIGFKNEKDERYNIVIPTGTYELSKLAMYIQEKMADSVRFDLKADYNTLKCLIKCYDKINFTIPNNISKLLGFEQIEYNADTTHESLNIVHIMKLNSIKIEYNLISGSFNNGVPDRTIHEFSCSVIPSVASRYKICEMPVHSVFYPLVDSSISKVSITLKDQDNNLINLRGEPIAVRLQIKH
jgi:hypothetical protein